MQIFVVNVSLLNSESTPPVIVEKCAKRISKLSKFFTIDVIKDVNGKAELSKLVMGRLRG